MDGGAAILGSLEQGRHAVPCRIHVIAMKTVSNFSRIRMMNG